MFPLDQKDLKYQKITHTKLFGHIEINKTLLKGRENNNKNENEQTGYEVG